MKDEQPYFNSKKERDFYEDNKGIEPVCEPLKPTSNQSVQAKQDKPVQCVKQPIKRRGSDTGEVLKLNYKNDYSKFRDNPDKYRASSFAYYMSRIKS